MTEITKNITHALFKLRFQCFLSNGALVVMLFLNYLGDGDRLLKFGYHAQREKRKEHERALKRTNKKPVEDCL